MPDYLSYQFEDSEAFINTFDELPLWSAPFGLLLLKHLELKPNLTVLDLGSGAGFPLTELASRMGNSCRLIGVDPWQNANKRARQKIANYGLSNVEIIESNAETLPFPDSSIDLIVSNLGINNFEKPDNVFRECRRVLKPGARLALTTNLNGHWQEFYDLFGQVLHDLTNSNLVEKLLSHQAHRGTLGSISNMYTCNGLRVTKHFEEQLEMKFIDGTAFLNHHFIKLGWLGSWKELLAGADAPTIFHELESRLNKLAAQQGGLKLSVPMAYIEGTTVE